MSGAAKYELQHPPAWQEIPGSAEDEDQNFSPGPDPFTGPVWLTVNTATKAELKERGFDTCAEYAVSEKYRRIRTLTVGDKEATHYSFVTPPGFPGEPGDDELFVVEVGLRCYRFKFFSPSELQWREQSALALKILSTVRFRD